jgi:Ca2+-binding RTX toxin-like protein
MNASTTASWAARRPAQYSFALIFGLGNLAWPAASALAANLVIDSGAGTGERGALFSVDLATGSRTLVSDFGDASQGPLGTNPVAVAVGTGGEVLVADLDAGTDARGALFKVNPGTGNRTILSDFGNSAKGTLGEDPVNLALGPAGEIIVVDLDAGASFSGALVSVNPVDGSRKLISDFGDAAQGPLGVFPLGAAFDASNQLFVTVLSAGPDGSGALFSVDAEHGTRTLVSDFGNATQGPLGEIPYGVTMAPTGEILVLDEDSGTDFRGGLFRVNPTNGNRTLLSNFNNAAQGPLGEDPVNLALSEAGEILVADFTAGAKLQGSLFRVNAATGKRTLVSDFGDASKGPLGQTPFGIAVVPEKNESGSLQFSTVNYNVAESSGSAKITVTRAGGSDGEVSIGYTVAAGGTATEGADYNFTNGVLTFAAGSTGARAFNVPIINDSDVETKETVKLVLSAPDGGATLGAPATATLTISDDEKPNAMCNEVPATIVGTGSDETLNGTVGADVIHARGGNDVIRGNGGNDIICGGWGNDQLYGGDGDDQLLASNGDDQLFGETGADRLDGGEGVDRCDVGLPAGSNTTDNCETVIEPKPGSLQFNAATYSAAENSGSVIVTVIRTGGSDGSVSVQYQASAGSAAQGGDFTATSGTLTFAAGDAAAKTFSVRIVNDDSVENDETVKLSLSDAGGGANLGLPNAATLTITDDDKTIALCAGQQATIVGTERSETINGTANRDVIQASGGNDVVRGNGGGDVICGGGGNDQLYGLAGRDQLLGQGGNDRLDGGEGYDRCSGGPDTTRDYASRCERITAVP